MRLHLDGQQLEGAQRGLGRSTLRAAACAAPGMSMPGLLSSRHTVKMRTSDGDLQKKPSGMNRSAVVSEHLGVLDGLLGGNCSFILWQTLYFGECGARWRSRLEESSMQTKHAPISYALYSFFCLHSWLFMVQLFSLVYRR
mmetsp:Transcript_149184/g.278116  ORF Transcript_149184/g.278116 Transcript_149184/m.278116 type:complete len:141 (+) Transcript_149184:1987-2409(+)